MLNGFLIIWFIGFELMLFGDDGSFPVFEVDDLGAGNVLFLASNWFDPRWRVFGDHIFKTM